LTKHYSNVFKGFLFERTGTYCAPFLLIKEKPIGSPWKLLTGEQENKTKREKSCASTQQRLKNSPGVQLNV
jgi:hypothetical protein